MGEFVQLHLLTAYPPSNLNRDDLGRPKSAIFGGTQRLRSSSQSLKRAWRTSPVFLNALDGGHAVEPEAAGEEITSWSLLEKHASGVIGVRTKRIGTAVHERLEGVLSAKQARAAAEAIARVFGKVKEVKNKAAAKEEPDGDADNAAAEEATESAGVAEIEQLAHVSPEEISKLIALVERLIGEKRAPKPEELELLRERNRAVDIALFGRMLTDSPKTKTEEAVQRTRFSMEAAAQVAHAITVHRVAIEDDYFSAVDDLNLRRDDVGAAHIGENEFGAGLFYLYLCVDRSALIRNLDGDVKLADRSLAALAQTAATVAPIGKQASFASRAYASFILAERGFAQPRSLAIAFFKAVEGSDIRAEASRLLRDERARLDRAYKAKPEPAYELDVAAGTGTMSGLLAFLSSPWSEVESQGG